MLLQDFAYTYDPAGNITHVQDDADINNVVYFSNRRVEPSADYIYDALYRLIEATGREHLGQAGGTPVPSSSTDAPRVGLPHPNDGRAMGRYREEYGYDEVGNILVLRHRGDDPSQGWKRCYQYANASNRLLSTGDPNDPHNPDSDCPTHYADNAVFPAHYDYDAHGNMVGMPHLSLMAWDFKDQLQATSRQVVNTPGAVAETTYYVYDGTGQRVRKVTEGQNGKPKNERIYLGGYEIYREYDNQAAVTLERTSLHVMDDKQRVALVETKTKGGPRETLPRFQLGNHLGSACLELDGNAKIISYEEYTPYGSTSYQAVDGQTDAPKRYRYTGKERDEENGFTYHGARYYAPWLGLWTSCDRIAAKTGCHTYGYAFNNPVMFEDPDGNAPVPVPAPAPEPAIPPPPVSEVRLRVQGPAIETPPAEWGPPGRPTGGGAGQIPTQSSSLL